MNAQQTLSDCASSSSIQ